MVTSDAVGEVALLKTTENIEIFIIHLLIQFSGISSTILSVEFLTHLRNISI